MDKETHNALKDIRIMIDSLRFQLIEIIDRVTLLEQITDECQKDCGKKKVVKSSVSSRMKVRKSNE